MKGDDKAKRLAVTALGLGTLPVAPGTWASAGAMVLYVLVQCVVPWPWAVVVLAAGIATCLWAGAMLCPWAQQYYGLEDPRPFVLDEVAGQLLTCLLLTLAWPDSLRERGVFALVALAAAFFSFRIMDVLKPFPIRRVEKLPGWWGVMLDDLLAAVYAAVVSWVVSPALLVGFPVLLIIFGGP